MSDSIVGGWCRIRLDEFLRLLERAIFGLSLHAIERRRRSRHSGPSARLADIGRKSLDGCAERSRGQNWWRWRLVIPNRVDNVTEETHFGWPRCESMVVVRVKEG